MSPSPQSLYVLDLAEAAGKKDFQIAVPTNGTISLTFIRTSSTNEIRSVTLYAGSFHGQKSGDELRIGLSRSNLVFGSNQVIASVTMEVPSLPQPDQYVGTLILVSDETAPILWRLTLTKAGELQTHPASLLIVPNKVKGSVTHHWFGRRNVHQAITATLQNTDKTWPLDGITVTPGEVISADHPEFDITRNVRFFLNGTNFSTLARSPTETSDRLARTLAAGAEAQLGLGFSGLSPGDYTFELNVDALNSESDEARQKLTVNVKVSDPVWPAIVVLVVAMFLSFFTYKWLKLYRQRIELQQRVARIRSMYDWLPQMPATYAVVWVRMSLKQAEELAGRLLLTSPALVTERLDKTVPVLEVLDAVQKLSTVLPSLSRLIRNRFGDVIDRTMAQMRNEGMTKDAADKAKRDLEGLFLDITGDNYLDRYWKEVKDAVSTFKTEFRLEDLPAEARTVAADAAKVLWPHHKIPDQPADGNEMINYEDTYARLRLLYERRSNPELFTQLLHHFDGPLTNLFDLADNAAWAAVRAAAKNGSLKITPPPVEDKIAGQAYETLPFSITSGNQQLDHTYLFLHGLRFEWSFKLRRSRFPWTAVALQPKATSPNVVQFAPGSGTLSVSVRLFRETQTQVDDIVVPKTIKVRVKKSSEVSLLGSLERTERWALLMAGLFALVSGLLTYYYKNPVFGSAQDYLSLFLWGVGVDQTKNFLQSMQAESSEPATNTPPKPA